MQFDYYGLRLRLCETVAERTACRDFSFEVMRTPYYGLTDLEYLEKKLWDAERYTYFAAHDTVDDELIGAFRLDFHYDLSRFHHLDESVMKSWGAGRMETSTTWSCKLRPDFHTTVVPSGETAFTMRRSPYGISLPVSVSMRESRHAPIRPSAERDHA